MTTSSVSVESLIEEACFSCGLVERKLVDVEARGNRISLRLICRRCFTLNYIISSLLSEVVIDEMHSHASSVIQLDNGLGV